MINRLLLIANLLIVSLFLCGCGGAEQLNPQNQSIGLTSVGNARELGGYSGIEGRKVKHGALLRTAALSNISSEDIQRLVDVYNLSVLVDLRMNMEVLAAPEPEIPGVKNLHLKIIDEEAVSEKQRNATSADLEGLNLTNKVDMLKLAVKLGIVSDKMYIDFLSGQQGKESYAILFQELLAMPEGKSLLFHCTQGKDRTGCAAMLILAALGVDEETIMSDYMLTNIFNAGLIESERQLLIEQGYSGDELDNLMKAMDEVDPKFMLNVIDWMKNNYGDITGYIKQELKLTDEQIEILRDKYLEE